MPRDYEMALIVDTQLADDGVDQAVKRYEALLGEQGAEVANVDRWGARKLAYEIRKRQQGDTGQAEQFTTARPRITQADQ